MDHPTPTLASTYDCAALAVARELGLSFYSGPPNLFTRCEEFSAIATSWHEFLCPRKIAYCGNS